MQREGKKANGRNIWYESAEIEYLSTQLSSRRGTKKKQELRPTLVEKFVRY